MRVRSSSRARGVGPGLVLAIEGTSGVGKSAVARRLARRLGAVLVREAYDRLSPRPSLDLSGPAALLRLERCLLLEETRRHSEAEDARRRGRIVVLDTGFLGPVTYAKGLAELDVLFAPAAGSLAREAAGLVRSASLGLPDLSIYLDLDEGAIERRARAAPRSHPARWRARHQAVGRIERRFWTRSIRNRAPTRVWIEDAGASAGTIALRIHRRMQRMAPPRRPPRSLALWAIRSLAGVPGRDHD